jgi:hypothetical protein
MSTLQAAQAEFQDAGKPVAYPIYLVDAQGWPVAGITATSITAGTTADTVIKATPGRLCRLLVVTAGSNAMVVYDNASGHTGTVIGAVAANAVAGTMVEAQAPALSGIVVQGNASNPAVTVIWS